MKKRILVLATFWAFLVMGGMAYAAGGEYSINGVVQGNYQHLDLDSNGAINITTNTTPPVGNTNKIVVQVNTDDFGTGKIVGIGGVKIDLTGGATGTGTTLTSGVYTFSGLPDGTYDVTVTPTHASYGSFTPTPAPAIVSFTGVSQTKNITFDATPRDTYSISGNVKALTGTAVNSVVMQLSYGSTVLKSIAVDQDASGNYEFEDLPDGVKYTVAPILSPKTFDPSSQNVTLSGADATLNFTELSTTTGQFTTAIKNAYKANTLLVGGIGGYGFYQANTPGPASVLQGRKTYFLFDPSWLSSKWLVLNKAYTIMWIDFSLTKNFKINLYAIDSSDNGTLLRSSTMNQASFGVTYKGAGTRWLAEVDTTSCSDSFSLSIKWPY